MNTLLQNAALSVYGHCRERGWFEKPAFQRLFQTAYFFYKRHFEDAFHPLVRENPSLFKNGHILDIGANIGYTASVFAGAISPGFRVFAFEPESSNAAQMAQTLKRAGWDDLVTIIHAAVGSESGTARLWLNAQHSADHRVLTTTFESSVGSAAKTESVPMVVIDQFMAAQNEKRVAFIKIDVQGYETAVCSGMAETLAKNPDAAVAVEYYPKGIRALGFVPEILLDFFRLRDYQPYWLSRNNRLTPVTYAAIPPALGPEAYADLLFLHSSSH